MNLLKLQELLGYKINQGGMCYGIAFMAIQAIIRDDVNTYISRIYFINSYEKNLQTKLRNRVLNMYPNTSEDFIKANSKNIALTLLVEDIKQASEKRSNINTRNNLTSEDRRLLDILSWLDGVQFYFNGTLEETAKLTIGQNDQVATDFFSTEYQQKKSLERRNSFYNNNDRQQTLIIRDNHIRSRSFNINKNFNCINNGYEKIFLKSKQLDFLTGELVDELILKIENSTKPIAFSISRPGHIIAIGKSSYSSIYLINHDQHELLNRNNAFMLISKSLFRSTHTSLNAVSIMEFSSKSALLSVKFKKDFSNIESIADLLHLALEYNYIKAIKVYVEAIVNSNVSNKQDLLAAKDKRCSPGLFSALQDGHAEAVKAYIEAIMNSNVNNKQDLLAAKRKDDAPGLFMALQAGHAEAVKAYVEAIANSNVSNKQDLLAAKIKDGTPGLFMALQFGHAETVKAYIEAIANSNVNNKQDLLAAKIKDGKPGLFIALQSGHAEAVKAYIEAIANSNVNNKQDLLVAKIQEDGTPGLFIALQAGHAETVNIYLKTIKDINRSCSNLIMDGLTGRRKRLKNMLIKWANEYEPTQNKNRNDYPLLINLLSINRGIIRKNVTTSMQTFNAIKHWK